jgi:hypothetical protein
MSAEAYGRGWEDGERLIERLHLPYPPGSREAESYLAGYEYGIHRRAEKAAGYPDLCAYLYESHGIENCPHPMGTPEAWDFLPKAIKALGKVS